MHLKLTGFLYYISMLFTAISWSAAIDWRPGDETGIVIQEEFIWWAVLSLAVTIGLYIYQRRLIKQRQDRREQ